MKKSLLTSIVVCLLLFTGKSIAQPLVGGRHEFGALIGVQGAQFSADPSIDQNMKISVGGKLYWNYLIVGNLLSIRAEVGVDNWGTKMKSDTSLNLLYLTLPAVAAQVKFGPLKVYVGPQLNLLLSAKQKDGGSIDAKDLFKSTDISGMAGAEVNLPFFIMLGARYNFGLSNISDISEQKIKNGAFMVYVGVHFRR
ncbi:outer membrane beta-barrel protein [Taibaiella soli]|uniref:Outer membrane protein beta-barrel domain-containing protein n=1 Tax=Taibaiella soli TaxID=1649169 RepID=A0A2W2ALN0_9BACT|nr:outer membrane beta-barrel protein [Taibaiella soli]PZF74462.1 hypothetical protein DN068_02455 [Taibaiella soli]